MKNIKFGFTLLEIFIVIFIICLLAAIAIPSFVRARELTEKKAVENELKKQAVTKLALEKPEPEIVTVTNSLTSLTEKEVIEQYEARKMARNAAKEKEKEEKRVAHGVEKMFEVDGVSFYSAYGRNNLFFFAINTNGVVTIAH
jgi:prepilin-type N-terminal cleavage/methylation domain-containing protein